ncbi:divergent polysaccharide deacetylase family protein, partial [Nitratireductor sp. GCM10026969]
MQPVRSDIDRPLGQNAPRGPRGRRPGWRDILLILCAVAVFAASGAIALRERPYRQPAPVAV